MLGTDRSSISSPPGHPEIMSTITATTSNTNPIDHAIVALLLAFEGICWIINELAGFHNAPLTAETAEPELIDPRDVYAIEAHFIEPTVAEMPDFEEYVAHMAAYDLAALTVKQLRRKAKGLAKGVHMMRKPELVALLA